MVKKIEQVISTIQVLFLTVQKNLHKLLLTSKVMHNLKIRKKISFFGKLPSPHPLLKKNDPSLSCSHFRDRQRRDLLLRQAGRIQSLSIAFQLVCRIDESDETLTWNVFVLPLVENFLKRPVWSFTMLLYWLSTRA